MSDIEQLLAEDGPVAAAIDGYSPRASQQLMAEAVADAMRRVQALVVEAGTGTGKTFAYLLPALVGGARTIISTGTRALQDQLFHRDLPTICNAIGRPVQTALLKGRSNYLCLHRLDLALAENAALSPNERRALIDWRDSTSSGDRGEVSALAEDSAVWPRVTSTTDNCLGQQCPMWEDCYVSKARREAQQADLVVVNHHLLLADMAFRESGFVEFLPDADAIVVDEAHQLPDIALEFFGVSISTRQLADVFDECEVAGTGLGGPPLADALREARTALARFREQAPGERGRHDLANLADMQSPIGELAGALGTLVNVVDALAAMDADLDQILERLVRLHDRLTITSAPDDAEGLRWMDVGARSLTMRMTPLDVSDRLRVSMQATEASWIFTSATLAVGEDFSHFTERMGLDEPRCLRFETPFDLANRAMLLVPRGLPQPADPAYIPALLEITAPLLQATAGGVFFLHTSYRALQKSAEWFDQRPALLDGRALYVQGDAPRDKLLSAFRKEGNAVLLATGTFWEGVDVRGDALTVVVIDKLPFGSPDDPLLVARSAWLREQGKNPFMHHQLPQAVLALKQGVGRLLRDDDDYGVIAIGDPRLYSRGYGKVFLKALAPIPVTDDASEAARFLTKMAKP